MEYLPPIHRAAFDGDLAEVNRLIEEDAGRLNAPTQQAVTVGGVTMWQGSTPLMVAAYRGHDAVVARLIELGADVGLRDSGLGYKATHWACGGRCASVLALLLNAGASINERGTISSWTPLIRAADEGAVECVALLLARGAELDAKDRNGRTALHEAANISHATIIQLLLLAGADPTIRDNNGRTPLDLARQWNRQQCLALVKVAIAEPQRPRFLLKARALLDAAVAVPNARDDARDKGLAPAQQQEAAVTATPAYLKGRVVGDVELLAVLVEGQDEAVVACLKYALGLEYGGGVHFEGEEKPVGMLREVFVELCELLVPRWDRPNV